MKRVLIVGGANGIGLSMASEMMKREDCEKIYIVDKSVLEEKYKSFKVEYFQFDLQCSDYTFFKKFSDVDTLIITAGFGKLALFEAIDEKYIIDSFNVNTIAVIRLIKIFYSKIASQDDFYCVIMGSIAGFMSSPYFAVYGATKAALKIFIESVNVELIKSGSHNRILNVSPGNIQGTNFYKKNNDLSLTKSLANNIIKHMQQKDDLYIPQYDEIYKHVLERYNSDFRSEGMHSYDYKTNKIRSEK